MIIVEHHDNKLDEKGTLIGLVGKEGSVEYAYQAEMWAQELLNTGTHRVYAYGYRTALAVWAYTDKGDTFYVGHAKGWSGEWQLPFLTDATGVATAIFGQKDIGTMDEAAAWAAGQLAQANIATAVVLDQDGVLAAWEKGPEGPALVAKGPRPLPMPIAA